MTPSDRPPRRDRERSESTRSIDETLPGEAPAKKSPVRESAGGPGAAFDGPGTVLGPYKLLQPLGEGGFGRVYQAEQREPVRRQVALKIVKLGLETERVIARFEAERQALAMMDHPGIAKVFDAGTTDTGRPYFVMELVKGVPITAYCDTHRLGQRQRLELFVEVCHAVQHAHQKGVIHRDLKPSNVLVEVRDGRPMPKVIDFGIAKAISGPLTDRTLVTELHQLIGTPEYMSPEQAEASGLDVDTRSDVYSLGVLLYELLTGVTPFDFRPPRSRNQVEIRRILREEDPPTPSSRVTGLGESGVGVARAQRLDPARLRRELRGDLDWIVMKALEKDRTRRYETADALATDVLRHLRHEPVSAGPPDVRYRLGKWMRRHRLACAAGSAVALALLLGIAGTSWGLWRAAAEAREARRQTAVAAAVNEFLNWDLLAAAAPSAARGRGREVTVREVLEVAGERLDEASRSGGRFADQPQIEQALRTTLGNTYLELGEYEAAAAQLSRGQSLAGAIWGERSPEYAAATSRRAWLASRQGRPDEAVALYETALAIAREALGPRHRDTLAYEQQLAITYRWQGRYREAEEAYRRVLEVSRAVLGPDDLDTLSVAGNLANLLQDTERCEEARDLRSELLERKRTLYGERDTRTVATLGNLANDLLCLGEMQEAVPLLLRALELKREIYGAEHPTTLNSVSNLAEAESILGHFEESERLHRTALDARRRVLGERHPRSLYSTERLAVTLTTLGRHDEAAALARQAAPVCIATLGEAHPDCIAMNGALAEAWLGRGQAERARDLLERQLELIEERRAADGELDGYQRILPELRFRLGLALARLGELDRAEPLLLASVEELPAHEARTRKAYEAVAGFFRQRARALSSSDDEQRASEWQRRADGWSAD